MNKIEKILIVVGIILAIAVAYLFLHKSPTASMVGEVAGAGVPSVFDNVSMTGVLQAGVNPNSNLTAIPTQFATGTVYAQGDLIQGGQCSVSSVISTTTLNLTAAQLSVYCIVHHKCIFYTDFERSSSCKFNYDIPCKLRR